MWHTTFEPLIWQAGLDPAAKRNASAVAPANMRLAAGFAAHAARSDDLPALQRDICRVAAVGLGVTFAKLLVYDSARRDFLLQAGVGWPEGIVGTLRLDADVGTAAGFAWHSGEPIISNNLTKEKRFRVPDLLVKYAIKRSINVAIPGDAEAAFGVLEVESPDAGAFTEHDVSFLQLLAHSLAAALARAALRAAHDGQATLYREDYLISLHELEHRVRNDLQVIYGVVAHEGHIAPEPAEVTGFERLGRRIMAVSQLYDHLLGQSDSSNVDFGLYLNSLCAKIALAGDLPNLNIGLRADTERMMMPADRAVKLGVAVNELVTNAVKHAFPDAVGGEIVVALVAGSKDGSTSSMISVSDNGCGFRGPRPGSAGMKFVEKLIKQAGGLLARERGEGTFWRIQLAEQEITLRGDIKIPSGLIQ